MPLARTRRACIRCRKQKLKCDNERPCALCERSGAKCRESPPRPRKVAYHTHRHEASPHESQQCEPDSGEPTTPARIDGRPLQSRQMTILQERKSTYGLVDQIFRSHNSRPEFGRSADAIPDGHPRRDTSLRTREVLIPIPELIGMDLPSRQVVNFMLDNFLESVHWFMMLFYQPTIRTEIDEIVTSGLIPKRRLSFLILVLLILAMGAKYAAQSDTVEHCSSSELANLRSKFMAKVEEKFLDVFDEGDIESVQISVLLASYYLYHRRPKRAFAVIGAGVKSAQALGLNRELSWGPVSSITREVRRRVWWALFVADGFTALCYGKPSTIQENDWQVDMVDDIDDASARCPGFNSTELREDGTYQPVTLLSYQRYKFDLYRIAAPITRTIYYHRGATMREVVARVKEINRWLVELEERIPPELKMASFSSHVSGATSNPAVRTFQLQALALQLSYDNIQLILHRPLLTYTGGLSTSPLSGPSTGGPSQGRSANDRSAGIPAGDDLSQGSRSQCWEAAIRTSQIGEYSWILETARDTHAAAYIGIQTFTAGAILAMFALTDPLASQAQEAKHAIARLIRMPQSAGLSTHVSDQSGGILEGLLRLILDEEMKSLISRGGIGSGRGSPPVALEGRGIRRADPSGPSTEAAGSAFRHSSHIPGLQGTDGREDGLVSSNAAPGPGTLPLAATGNVTETMTLMQHVFRDGGGAFEDLGLLQQGGAAGRVHGQDYGDEVDLMLNPEPLAEFFSDAGLSDAFNDYSQTWIWDPSICFE